MKKNNTKFIQLLLLPTLISAFTSELSAENLADSQDLLNSNIILNYDLNGRINRTDKLDFSKRAGNIAGVLKKNTSGTILKVVKMPSGNLGIKLNITSGNFKDKDLWIYYNVKNPNIEFSKNINSTSHFDIGNKARLLTDLEGHEDLENESLKQVIQKALPLLTKGADKELNENQRIKCQENNEEITNKVISYTIKNGVVTKNGVPLRIDGNKVTSVENPLVDDQNVDQNEEQESHITKVSIADPQNKPLAAVPAVLSLLKQAHDLEQAGELDQAVSTVERALKISPQYSPLYLKLAELNILQNHYTNAYNLALKGLSKKPDEATKNQLNKVKRDAEKYKLNNAENDTSYQKEIRQVDSLSIKPKSLIEQADDSIAAKRYDEAAERLEDNLKNSPDDYQSYQKLIAIKMSQKFFTEAKQIAERAQQSKISINEKINIKNKGLEAQIEIEKVNLLKMKKGH